MSSRFLFRTSHRRRTLLAKETKSATQRHRSTAGRPQGTFNSIFIIPKLVFRASQKSEVKKRSPSCKMKGMENHFHEGETQNGLYNTTAREPSRPRAAHQADAIALPGVPPAGRWAKGAREAL